MSVSSIGISAVPVTIAAGASLSSVGVVGLSTPCAIEMPGAWTAADLTFLGSYDGGTTFIALYNTGGTPMQFSAGASTLIGFDPGPWRGINAVKVQSGAIGAGVTQVADRVINLIVRPII